MNIFDDHIDNNDDKDTLSFSFKEQQSPIRQETTAFDSKCLIDTNLMHFSISNNDEEDIVDRNNKLQDFVASPTIKMQTTYALNNNNGNENGSF